MLLAVFALSLALASRAEAFVYWGDQHRVGRANLNGTGVNPNFITGGADSQAVAVNATHLFWANWQDGTIGRANLDGTGVDKRFITGAEYPTAVAVDAAHIYWTNRERGTIGRANLDGTGVDHRFISGLSSPVGVAVDADHIYWGGYSLEIYYDAIGRANLDGTGVDDSFIPYAGVGAVDAKSVYWINGLAIGRANLDGTGVDDSFIPYAGDGPVALSMWRSTPRTSTGQTWGRIMARPARSGAPTSTAWASTAASSPGRTSDQEAFAGPGTLKLTRTKSVKGARSLAEVKGKAKLPVRPRGKAKERLESKGKAKIKAKVTYTPDGGDPNVVASTLSKVLRLVRRG